MSVEQIGKLLLACSPEELRKAKKKFQTHRSDAKQRGIGFEFDFESWLNAWIESGHWDQRGCHRGQYVMARYNDRGAYRVGNVKIIECGENVREGEYPEARRMRLGWVR